MNGIDALKAMIEQFEDCIGEITVNSNMTRAIRLMLIYLKYEAEGKLIRVIAEADREAEWRRWIKRHAATACVGGLGAIVVMVAQAFVTKL